MVPSSSMNIPDLSHTMTVPPDVLEMLKKAAPPVQPSEAMLRGAPPTLFGMPVIVSEFLPSWVVATIGVPGKGGTMLIRWNKDYRKLQAERFREKGWRARVESE